MFLRDNDTAFTLTNSADFRNKLNVNATKIEGFLKNVCAKISKNAATQEKLRNMKITGNLAKIKELLEPDIVQTLILAGTKSCKTLLLPLLAEYFSSSAVTKKEKEGKVRQLKNDFSEVSRISKEEFDDSLKDLYNSGVQYFKENVNSAIRPYKL